MRPVIKICGLTREEDVRMCVRNGADIVGFVVDYPRPVPWNLDINSARKLISAVPKPAKTCVVTGGSPDKILKLAMELRPDYVQLHYGETLEDTVFLLQELKVYGINVIKTVFPNTPNLDQTVLDFCKAGVCALLFDPRTPDNAVESSSVNLSVYDDIRKKSSCPVVLAGGITPANVVDVINRSEAQYIDLMTGVESSLGKKDESKVSALFQAIKTIDLTS